MSKKLLIFLTLFHCHASANEVIKERIQTVNDKILELEVSIELGNEIDPTNDILELNREIWSYKNILNTSNDNINRSWNESELLLLEAKNRLDRLNEKIKLEGSWGKIGLKLDREEQYRKLDLKYRYGF